MTADRTLVARLRRHAGERPDQRLFTFLDDEGRESATLTFAELDARARALAARLQEHGAAGERALLLFPPGLAFVEAFFGCLYACAVAVPTPPPGSGRRLERLRPLVADARPRLVLAPSGILEGGGRRRLEALPGLQGVSWVAVDEVPAEEAAGWRDPAAQGGDLAFLQYTSGSTSTPKGVAVTHGNLMFMEALIQGAFGQDERSVVAGWLPVYHDMGLIGNVLQPLYLGASCVLMSPVAFLRRPRLWLEAVSRYRATTSGGPNFAYDLCAARIPDEEKRDLDLSSWRVAFNGAEPVRADTLERFAAAFAPCGFRPDAFLPCYGLAEATLLVSGNRAAPGRMPRVLAADAAALEAGRLAPPAGEGARSRELVACGQVPAGVRVAIVDPATLRPCAPGEVGEVWVAGPGVAAGYWRQPEATRETFQAYRSDPGEGSGPYLRTGDLGAVDGGELFLCGRLKDLIILRGRNLYPQDVERTAETSAPGLARGGGAAFSIEVDGEERLVLAQEVESRRALPPDELEALASALRRAVAAEHEAMIYDVVLLRPGALPKTSSGKVQRRACRRLYLEGRLEALGSSRAGSAAPAPPVETEGRGVPAELRALRATTPADPAELAALLEPLLRRRIAELLRVTPDELADDRPLLELGLDSLAAIELSQAVEKELGLPLPMSAFLGAVLEGAGTAGLAAQLSASLAGAPETPPAEGVEQADGLYGADKPLSQGERGLWFLHRLAPSGTAYHLTAAARLHGDVPAETLRRAFAEVVSRHEALRSTFAVAAAGEPVRRVEAAAGPRFEEVDATRWNAGRLRSWIAEEAFRPFDLQRGPLLRVTLFRAPGGERVLLVAVHHLAADFWSLGLLARQLGDALAGANATGIPVPRASDFARWQAALLASEEGERLEAFWRERLAGLPPLELPLDRPRPAVRNEMALHHPLEIGPGLLAGLRRLARRQGTTLYAVLLAGFQALLHRLTGQDDLAVGSPAAGRPAGFPGAAETVGYLVNTLVLRADLAGEPSFAGLLARTRAAVLDALEHQAFPLPLLAERLRLQEPFSAMFVFHRPPAGLEGLASFALGEGGGWLRLGPVELESLPLPARAAQFDLTLTLADRRGGLGALMTVAADLFEAATAERWLAGWERLLEGAAADPDLPVAALPLLSERELHQITAGAETPVSGPPPWPTIGEAFERQAERTPERVALIAQNGGQLERLTYAELSRRARDLAARLRELGAGPETVVAVSLPRTADLVVALLGVLESGAAYLPLDPAYPEERRRMMLEDSGAGIVIGTEGHGPGFPSWTPTARHQRFSFLCRSASLVGAQFIAPPTVPLSETVGIRFSDRGDGDVIHGTDAITDAGLIRDADAITDANAIHDNPAAVPAENRTVLAHRADAGAIHDADAIHNPATIHAQNRTVLAHRTDAGAIHDADAIHDNPATVQAQNRTVLAHRTSAGAMNCAPTRDAEAGLMGGGEAARESTTQTHNLAYLIYTSGSTGRPKGVAIEHRSAVRRLAWAGEAFSSAELSGMLASTSVSFDLSVFEIFAPLVHGGTVILAENALALPGLEAAAEVTFLNTVPSAAAALLEMGPLPPRVRTVGLAGEALPRALADRFQAAGAARVLNLYGPSEDTTYSTVAEVTSGASGPPPIGRPLPGTRALVLDRGLRPVPLGVAGELFLGGEGLARGYLGRPELTAERFVPDPLSRQPGERLYRTGDRARRRFDGELEFLGRLDRQVKVRGFRIEPGEVEAALLALPWVSEAAVVAKTDRLAAYVVLSAAAPPHPEAALVAATAERLPAAFVPSDVVVLPAMPRTPSGKVDRAALPEPERASGGESAAPRGPRGPIEELIAGIWAELLGVEAIGREDRFATLGGHSLLAVRAVARVREALGVEIPLPALFEGTLAALAARVESQRRGPVSEPVPRADRNRPLPLSAAQRRLWLLDRLEAVRAAYHLPLLLRLRGDLDVPALETALAAAVARHEALRTSFPLDGDTPVQRIAPPPESWPLPRVDLCGLPGAAAEADRLARAEAARPFDLQNGPVFRTLLLTLSPDEHRLVLHLHHIAADFWSLGILLRDVTALYGRHRLPELAVQYADYAVWEQAAEAGRLADRLGHLRDRLAGLPPLELPADRPRPPVRTGRGAVRPLALPRHLAAALTALGRHRGATPFMVLLAGFAALLHRYTGQTDLALGTAAAGRDRPELEGVVGCFLNTLALRADLAGDPPFEELLARARGAALEAFEYRDVPFERLVEELRLERDLSRPPLVQALLVLQTAPVADPALPGMEVEASRIDAGAAQLELSLSFRETARGLEGTAEYATGLFDAATVDRLGRHLETLLSAAVAAPRTAVSALEFLTGEERRQILGEWSAGVRVPAGAPPWETLAEAFSLQAARTPERTALVAGEERLTYAELDRRVEELAGRLRRLGAGPEVVVGVKLPRSAGLLVALLAVHRAGAAYLPLDPAYPAERLGLMLEDSGAALVIGRDSGEPRDEILAAPMKPLAARMSFSVPRKRFSEGQERFSDTRERSAEARERFSEGRERFSDTPERSSETRERFSEGRERFSDTPERSAETRERFSEGREGFSDTSEGSTETRERSSEGRERFSNTSERPSETRERFSEGWERSSDTSERSSEARERFSEGQERFPETRKSSPETRENPRPSSGNLAYLIYTSGSTGRPKGVAIEHRSAVHLLSWALAEHSSEELAGVLASTSVSFDLSIFEIFVPLATGGTVILAQDALAFPALPAASEVTLINTVPSAATALLELLGDRLPPGVHTVNLAGEPLRRALVDRLYAAGATRVLNLYGPSEDTTYSTGTEVPRNEPGEPTLGRPIAGSRAYVLDPNLRPLPAGLPGELCLGGEGLARGYHGAPDRTAERFVPDPVSGLRGARLYRTGDRARWRPDGELELLGRMDRQVKIRGYRIEPGEVEAVLTAHPLVDDAAVIAWDGGLAAYVSLSTIASVRPVRPEAGLRAYLAERLPAPLVPAHVIVLPALPLTPNGKVDRAALPRPERASPAGAVASGPPEGPVEEVLAGIWSRLLGVRDVDRGDRFFDLGGHSLLAARLVARVRDALGVEMPLSWVFEEPGLAGLARRIESAHREAAQPLERVPRDRPLPLSFAQERFWFLDRLEPAQSAAYNLALALRLRGVLRLPALEAALAAAVRRHEVLRTALPETEEGPVQVVLPDAGPSLPLVDLGGLPVAIAEAEASQLARAEAAHRFDLRRGPLLRAGLVRLGEADHLLLLTVHHAAADYWSLGLLLEELAALYADPATPLPELPIQYADFAAWEWRSGVPAEQLRWWRERLDGLTALELPADRQRPARRTWAGATLPFVLPQRLADRLAALGRRQNATLFMVLLAGFQALLHRWTGETDLAVGTAVSRRDRTETEGLIGCFLNLLVLRTVLPEEPPFAALLGTAREVALSAYLRRDLPFEKLVEDLRPQRDLSRHPLFDAMLVLQNAPFPLPALPGLAISRLPVDTGAAQHDLAFTLAEDVETAAGLGGTIEYANELFDTPTVHRLAATFVALLEAVADDPEVRVAEIPLLDPATRHQLLVEWGGQPLPEPATDLIRRFHQQAEAMPDAVAVEGGEAGEVRLTYRELAEEAAAVTDLLRDRGVGPEDIVALDAWRAPEMVAAVLGVLEAGAAFVPLDPAHPLERRAAVIADARPRLLLAWRDDAPAWEGLETLHLVHPRQTEPRTGLNSSRPGFQPRPGVRPGAEPPSGTEPPSGAAPPAGVETPAYWCSAPSGAGLAALLYTSGSTGRPKGVMLTRGALAGFLASAGAVYGLQPGDRVLQFASLSFDAALEEIFCGLLSGATLVLRDPAMTSSVETFLEACRRLAVTFLDLPTAFWHEVAARLGESADLRLPPAVRAVTVGGERMLPAALAAWQGSAPESVRLFNTYGPTEATVIATAVDLAAAPPLPGREVSLGRPLAGAGARVLSAAFEPVPLGAPGELFLSGPFLARGYQGRPDLTAERFLPDPWGIPGARLYRTGDRARFRPDGELEYLGRTDTQVKIRGHRVEPGEVEAALAALQEVHEAAVVAREAAPGELRLVAYFVPSPDGAAPSALELKAALRNRLPEPLVPAVFVSLAALPKTVSGKVDRRRLPEPPREMPEAVPAGAGGGGDPVREAVAEIWAEVLGLHAPIAMEADFFDLGGHSLLATRALSRIRRVFGVDLPLLALFEEPTLAGFARRVSAALAAAHGAAPVPPIQRHAPAGGADMAPLSASQERLWFLDRLQGQSRFYNLSGGVHLRGRLDAAALQAALSAVVRRHGALRTTFGERPVEGEMEPVQVVSAAGGPIPLPVIDLAALPEAAREAEAGRLATGAARQPFDLRAGPLLRALLLRLGEAAHTLALGLHHIVGDAWSLGLLTAEVTAAYGSLLQTRTSRTTRTPRTKDPQGEGVLEVLDVLEVLGEPPLQYTDFARWQREWLAGDSYRAQLDAWRDRLAGLPVLDLPADFPRPAVQTFRGAVEPVAFPPELTAGLRTLARRHGVTLFMTLAAGFGALLSRLTGQTDIALGTDIANRERPELEGVLGFFVNSVVLRLDLSGDPSFAELLGRVRQRTLEAYALQAVPFQKVVEAVRPVRDPSRNPLFQVLLILQNAPAARPRLPGLDIAPLELADDTSVFDLSVSLQETPEEPDGSLTGGVRYNTDLFAPETVRRLLKGYAALLAEAVARPEARATERERRTMDSQKRKESKFDKLAAVQPKAVRVSAGELVRTSTLPGTHDLPLVVEPAPEADAVDLVAWGAKNREQVAAWLRHHGGVLFRGFEGMDSGSLARFQSFLAAVSSAPIQYKERSSPRSVLQGEVYTSTDHPADQPIVLHNEQSYTLDWPLKIAFYCVEPALEGGRTPLADSRRILARLSPRLREELERRGILYVRNYGDGLGLPWRVAFQTDDPAEVERFAREAGLEVEWKGDGRLRTRQVRPAVRRHPLTGEPVWFNHALFFHVSSLPAETRDGLLAGLAPEDLPANTFYGDGAPIEPEALEEIRRAYEAETVSFPWQPGDVLLLDNMLVAHGREPFQGPRRIAVAMADPVSALEAAPQPVGSEAS